MTRIFAPLVLGLALILFSVATVQAEIEKAVIKIEGAMQCSL